MSLYKGGFNEKTYSSINYYKYNSLAVVHSQSFQSVIDYRNTKEFYTKIYGEPEKDKIIWNNPLHKGNYNHYGRAIALGQLEFYCEWKALKLILKNKNNNIKLNIKTKR